ncbi:MAG: NAD(P)-dependent oxidoreductase [Candidatus Margulisbacteria bacterium]|jgi:nucleoside-diphosphate-sugar epimerase|nr:NAD(P)-dependent oxidoreductase [Candidatus Margulisiibacteriota bacterium]
MRKIFITGGSGCVGHYLIDRLAPDKNNRLYLLVRDPRKLLFDPARYPNITLIKDDLANISRHAELLREMESVIHLAADWGGSIGNFEFSRALLQALDPARCRKVLYFSTASILGADGRPVVEADSHGTHYIRGKHQMHQLLPQLPIYPNLVTLFPTWVIGGDRAHPYSHAASGLRDVKKWLWLIRRFTIDASFHFIHAADIAAIAVHLLDHPAGVNEYILGNAPLTATELIKQVCAYHGVKTGHQLTISLPLVKFLAAVTGHKLQDWDRYCFERRHFTYAAVNAESFGLRSELKTIPQVLTAIGA